MNNYCIYIYSYVLLYIIMYIYMYSHYISLHVQYICIMVGYQRLIPLYIFHRKPCDELKSDGAPSWISKRQGMAELGRGMTLAEDVA